VAVGGLMLLYVIVIDYNAAALRFDSVAT